MDQELKECGYSPTGVHQFFEVRKIRKDGGAVEDKYGVLVQCAICMDTRELLG